MAAALAYLHDNGQTEYSWRFLAEHKVEIELYWVAQADMKRLLAGVKLTKMEVQ